MKIDPLAVAFLLLITSMFGAFLLVLWAVISPVLIDIKREQETGDD